jgi:hypothetical protein
MKKSAKPKAVKVVKVKTKIKAGMTGQNETHTQLH